MNKKAFFYAIDLYPKVGDTVLDYKRIPELLNNIIDLRGEVNGTTKTLDLTPVGEYLHTMLDVIHYGTGYMFARASKQRPTGSVIGRDYATKKVESLLPGISEDRKGIELSTYIYIDYHSCILEVISAVGAPDESIVADIFKYYSLEYRIKLTAIPNANGVEKIYGKDNLSISSMSIEIPYPDPAILEMAIGQNGNRILREATNGNIKVTMNISSSFARTKLTNDTERSNAFIDAVSLIKDNFKSAKIRAKANNIRAREYNFFEENFYYPVDIPSYKTEGGNRIYFNAEELLEINLENMIYSFNVSRELLLPLINRR